MHKIKEPFLGTSKGKSALSRDYCYITIRERLSLSTFMDKQEPSLGGLLLFTERREPSLGDYYYSLKGENPLKGLSMDTCNGKSMRNSEKGSSTRKANEHGMTIEHGFMSDYNYNTCM